MIINVPLLEVFLPTVVCKIILLESVVQELPTKATAVLKMQLTIEKTLHHRETAIILNTLVLNEIYHVVQVPILHGADQMIKPTLVPVSLNIYIKGINGTDQAVIETKIPTSYVVLAWQ